MVAKIFRSIFFITLIVLLLSRVLIFWMMYGNFNNRLVTELSNELEYISAGTEMNGTAYLQSLSDSDVRVTWIDRNGDVIYDTRADESAMENHMDRQEIIDAFETGYGQSVRYSQTLAEPVIYCAERLSDGTVLRICAEQYPLWAMVLDMLQPVIMLFVFAAILAALAAYRMSRAIVKPINNLDLEHPENCRVYPELQPVVDKLSAQRRGLIRQMDELRFRQTEFDAITSNMSEGMIIINDKAEVISCNRCAADMLGITGDIPKSILYLNIGDDLREAISTAFSGQADSFSVRMGEKFYSMLVTPVIHDGSVEGAVIVILDETEKEERDRLRREFTSNVSHELKTPLTSISGFAELIRSGLGDAADVKHFADNIYKEAQRLIVLVGDIIKLSQLDGREMIYDDEPIDLFEAAKSTVSRLSNIAESAGIQVQVSGENAMIRGSMRIIEEMIYNLVDNGIKYNRRGGSVSVDVSAADGGVRLSVSDTGIGIPRDQLDRVFERFYRVDKSHSKEIGGTGLGLSIVKHGAVYHKAKLSIDSELGKGTCISIIFKRI